MTAALRTLCGKEAAREVVKEAAQEEPLLQGGHLLPSGPDEAPRDGHLGRTSLEVPHVPREGHRQRALQGTSGGTSGRCASAGCSRGTFPQEGPPDASLKLPSLEGPHDPPEAHRVFEREKKGSKNMYVILEC